MSKKFRLRGPLHKQCGKQVETLIQSQRQLLYHIRWSLWRYLSWKMLLVATCKVLRLFVNTVTADDKYSLLSRDNSMQRVEMHFWQKQKSFSNFFCTFFQSTSNFEHFEWKMTLIAYVFPKFRARRTWLDKCLKSSASDDPSTGHMVNGPKHSFNLDGSSFTIFVDHCEGNWVGKSHS